jgi:hypothetical protein
MILEFLGSSVFGTLLGGFFAFMNKRNELEAKRLDHAHAEKQWVAQREERVELRGVDLQIAQAEAQRAKDVAVAESEGRIESARMSALAAAQTADKVTAEELKAAGKWRWVLVLATGFNKLIRPIATITLTYYAVRLSLLLIERMTGADWGVFSATQKFDTGMEAFRWVTAQASAALGYWFMARGSSK